MSAINFELFTNRKSFGNVQIVKTFNEISVLLHGNNVFTYNTKINTVKLSNCGWVTRTTHKAINNALGQIKAPVHVCQRKGETVLCFHKNNMQRPLVNDEVLDLNYL